MRRKARDSTAANLNESSRERMITAPTGPPQEADWNNAPGLLDGAMNLLLTPEKCDLAYWIGAVAQGTWLGLKNGHSPDLEVPSHMLEPGPLRLAIMDEFAFRSIGEEMATRALSYLVASAPSIPTMEFYATQVIDEARHSWAFRTHLTELGIAREALVQTIEEIAGRNRDAILKPLEAFGLSIMRDERDFIGGVVIITILVEGVLAPAAELSERKWRLLDPPAASIDRGANIDEIRHLTVGSSIVRQHLLEHPEDKPRILDLIARGRRLWDELPTRELIYRREQLFQEGIEAQRKLIGDYELLRGRRLVDTTAEDRVEIANQWSEEMQNSRLAYMGLEEAIP